jgi:hypothetical protein
MLKRRIFLSIGILTNILFIYVAFALSFPDVFTIESFVVFILSLVSFFGAYLLFYLGISYRFALLSPRSYSLFCDREF